MAFDITSPKEVIDTIALTLIDDMDVGVKMVALKSIPEQTTDALRAKVKALSTGRTNSAVRHLARLTLTRIKV